MYMEMSIESFLNKGGDLMDWEGIILNSIKWGIIGGLMFLLGVIVVYGGVHVALGVFQGVVWYVVLGFMLFVAALTLLHLLTSLVLYWIDLEEE